jgi:hypothetical protein
MMMTFSSRQLQASGFYEVFLLSENNTSDVKKDFYALLPLENAFEVKGNWILEGNYCMEGNYWMEGTLIAFLTIFEWTMIKRELLSVTVTTRKPSKASNYF